MDSNHRPEAPKAFNVAVWILNITMLEPHIELIKRLLSHKARQRSFKTAQERALWEKGYLIGLLASLSYYDSANTDRIRRKIKD